jgi:tetratricopeptide (TPR) repeat protein
MKKPITLIVFLLTCFNLSVSARHKDTTKTLQPDSVRLANHSDLLSLPTPVIATARFTPYGSRRAPESVNYSAIIRTQDSLELIDATHLMDSLAQVAKVNLQDSLRSAAATRHLDSLRSPQYAHLMDSLKRQLKSMSLDSLKQQAKTNPYELLTGPIYSEIALKYLDYDTISNKKRRLSYQNEALNYTMRALHRYSMYNDTAGLRDCFDNLAKVYFAQRKYPQAKWFILQSNTLSRVKKDTANIITSLLTLSAIKSDIQDYGLAMKDLNEALLLSVTTRNKKIELDVLKNFALLYSRTKNYPKEALVLKKRDSLEDSIRKDEEARLLARVTEQHARQVKKLDSLQSKKKVYTYNIKRPYKGNSAKKTVLL